MTIKICPVRIANGFAFSINKQENVALDRILTIIKNIKKSRRTDNRNCLIFDDMTCLFESIYFHLQLFWQIELLTILLIFNYCFTFWIKHSLQ